MFPDALVQTCIVHLLRQSLAFVAYKDRKEVAAALKEVYRAVDAAAGAAALAAFEEGPWGRKYPAIGPGWRRAWGEVVPFYVLVFVVYWCYGTQVSVMPSTVADLYGSKNLGLNYGVLFTAWGAAGTLGPIVRARVFDRFGDYRYAFFTAGALAAVACASLAFVRAPSDVSEMLPALSQTTPSRS